MSRKTEEERDPIWFNAVALLISVTAGLAACAHVSQTAGCPLKITHEQCVGLDECQVSGKALFTFRVFYRTIGVVS